MSLDCVHIYVAWEGHISPVLISMLECYPKAVEDFSSLISAHLEAPIILHLFLPIGQADAKGASNQIQSFSSGFPSESCKGLQK